MVLEGVAVFVEHVAGRRRNYIRNIYEKLQVYTKSAAVSKAMRAGLL